MRLDFGPLLDTSFSRKKNIRYVCIEWFEKLLWQRSTTKTTTAASYTDANIIYFIYSNFQRISDLCEYVCVYVLCFIVYHHFFASSSSSSLFSVRYIKQTPLKNNDFGVYFLFYGVATLLLVHQTVKWNFSPEYAKEKDYLKNSR